jgi:hypothetical protein
MRGRALAGLVILGALLLAACGPASPAATTPAATTNPTPVTTATVTAVPTALVTAAPPSTRPSPGPATFQLTVAGDPNVTGAWSTGNGINCNNPTLAGLNILAFATAPDTKAIVVLTFSPGVVNVSERAGSGASYTAREFVGTGVSAYDPARGATFDSDVTIVATPDINPGTLGTITHVSGSVDCGNQTTGTSTIVVSGESAEGELNGPFTTYRVICNTSAKDGRSANIVAVMDTATPPTYFIIGLPANGNATIFTIAGQPPKQHTYAFQRVGVTTLQVTATGLIRINASFAEVVELTETPHVIHLAGEATCGTFNKS